MARLSATHAIVALFLMCGIASACQPPHCDRVDMGTCGNACCTLDFVVALSPEDVVKSLSTQFASGGPDGRYTFQEVAEAPGTPQFADLRKYNISAWFIGQAWHTTKVAHYNDTNNWTVSPGPTDNTAVVRGFSTSQIGGALGDSGQNYKNLKQIAEAAFPTGYIEHTVSGCPPVSS